MPAACTFAVSILELPPDFASRKGDGVNVRVAESIAHGLDDGVKLARGDPLTGGPQDVGGIRRAGDRGPAIWTYRLAAPTAQEEHDASRDPFPRERHGRGK